MSGSPYERLGAKVLSLPDVIAQSVGFMGPVFSSAFVIPLVVGVVSASGKGGGVAAPLSVLIAAVGVFAIGWIVSSYAKEIHAAGSLYDYVSRGLGARVGTAAGWLYYAGVTVLLTGLLMLIGGYLQSTIAAEFRVNPLPAWAWTLVVIALIGIVLYYGVRVSVRAQLVLALVSIAVVSVFFIVVVYLLMAFGALRSFGSRSAGRVRLYLSVVLAVLITAGAIFGSFYKVTTPTILAPWFALGVLVIGYASSFVIRPRAAASTQLGDLTESAV